MKFSDRFLTYPSLKSVIVNLKSGTAFKAIYYRARGDFVILRNSELLQDRGTRVNSGKVDGEILIRISEIDFIQVL